LLLFTVFAAACGTTRPTSPASFLVRPDVRDSSCNGGRGVRTSSGVAHPVLAAGTTADGSTLVALSSIYPARRFVVLHSITASCGSSTSIVTISRPAGGLWVEAVAPRKGGGAILAGTYARRWVVGAVDRRARLDGAFGDGGWTVLPFRGAVTAVLEEPSGRIVVAGGNGGGGCCTRNFAATLSAVGRLVGGRTELPTGEDSAVAALVPGPAGAALADVVYGNMGCWGVELAKLTPDGKLAPGFVQRLERFRRALGFEAFVGDVVADARGFTLVGTGQRRCAAHPSVPSAATGLVVRFRWDGRRVGAPLRFRSRMYGTIRAFPDAVAEAPYADPTRITIAARRSVVAVVRTPWRGADAADGTTVAIDEAAPQKLVVVAVRDGSDELQLVRLRLRSATSR
jgi:hypothetical protein